jgi:hypothetical protein
MHHLARRQRADDDSRDGQRIRAGDAGCGGRRGLCPQSRRLGRRRTCCRRALAVRHLCVRYSLFAASSLEPAGHRCRCREHQRSADTGCTPRSAGRRLPLLPGTSTPGWPLPDVTNDEYAIPNLRAGRDGAAIPTRPSAQHTHQVPAWAHEPSSGAVAVGKPALQHSCHPGASRIDVLRIACYTWAALAPCGAAITEEATQCRICRAGHWASIA